MGWLKLRARPSTRAITHQLENDRKSETQHIETVHIISEPPQPYPQAAPSVLDSELPFIPADEVVKRKSAETGGLFIVVDDIVYDCTEFIHEHPGGVQVIESFAGAECSWQFWRFHGQSDLETFGRPLRVGRTKGLQNRFKEPPKYVGLRRLGDEWD